MDIFLSTKWQVEVCFILEMEKKLFGGTQKAKNNSELAWNQ